jgi:glycosyltransferase involved in cell wall biosynthesis
MKFDFSVCTPVYNRAKLLPRLYKSLLENSFDNVTFEWLLIDDGSTDDIESFISQVNFSDQVLFRYIKKENQGKHSCLNIAFEQANSELFLILDSDDLLAPNALMKIKSLWKEHKKAPKLAGIIGNCLAMESGKMLGDSFPQNAMLSTILANSYKLNLAGDRCDFIRTELLKNKRFPIIDGERFMPEAIVMQDFDLNYKYLCINDFFKVVEYQQGGLSDSYARLAMNNPQGMVLRFEKILNEVNLLKQVDFKAKIKMYGNYSRYLLHSNRSFFSNVLSISKFYPFAFIIGFFAGISLYFKDNYTRKE